MSGEFVRKPSPFRDWISTDSASRFIAAPNRYHLYVSYACPWAHRTLIMRALKGLEALISVSVVHPIMPEESWVFADYPDSTPDTINGFKQLSQVYQQAQADFDGVVSVPVLYDKQTQTIVNNESAEIMRMFNSAFSVWAQNDVDYYPQALQSEIDTLNQWLYDNINDGVYKAGFATEQSAYDKAYAALFTALDTLEQRLSAQRYLFGSQPTESDWRLFTSLVRFDAVYYNHFKCNQARLVDYPQLWAYTRDLYQTPGIAATVNLDHIKQHYFASHKHINPSGIVPNGPRLDFNAPQSRATLF